MDDGKCGNHLDLTKVNLPVNSISVFLIGYVTEQVQIMTIYLKVLNLLSLYLLGMEVWRINFLLNVDI